MSGHMEQLLGYPPLRAVSVLESNEVPLAGRLDQHFFVRQALLCFFHVRRGDVRFERRFVLPFHVKQEQRGIFRALRPVVNLAALLDETWLGHIRNQVLHRVDRIGANMEIGGNCIRDCGHQAAPVCNRPRASGEVMLARNA